jgi:hypothetical protein
MMGASAKSITASVMSLAALPSGTAFSETTSPSLVLALAGRWSGSATMTPVSGPAEPFKCVITYFPNSDGTQVKQNLRCKGAQSKIDAVTQLLIDDGKVTGKWQDNVYSLDGTVSGTSNATGFDLKLDGDYFQASMVITSSPCEQQLKLVPRDQSGMKEMAALLKRC